MSMGDSKAQEVNVNGRTYIERTPAKKLSASIKAKLLNALKRDDVTVELKHMTRRHDTYHIKDASGKKLFTIGNSYKNGYYNIIVDGVVVAEMDWFESDGITTKDQRDIFEVLRAVQKKEEAIHIKNYMTLDEIHAWKITNNQER